MDGENNGKPYEQMDDFGRKTHYFRKHPYLHLHPYKKHWNEVDQLQDHEYVKHQLSDILMSSVEWGLATDTRP